MRSVVGYAKLLVSDAAPLTYLLEARGLDRFARLLKFWNGADLPDLTPYDGKIVYVAGYLPETTGNLGELTIHPWDIQLPPEGSEFAISPLFANVTGNLGAEKPKPNPRGDRVAASICYSSAPSGTEEKGAGSWLHLAALYPSALCAELERLEPGSLVHAFGELRHYDYRNTTGAGEIRPRTHLELLDVQVLRTGGRARPNQSLLGDAGRTALPSPTDAFTDAA